MIHNRLSPLCTCVIFYLLLNKQPLLNNIVLEVSMWSKISTTTVKCERSFEAWTNLLVREQFLNVCSPEMALLRCERVPQNTEAIPTLAEQYIEAHSGCITGRSVKKTDVTMKQRLDSWLQKTGPSQPTKSQFSRNERECFYCNKKGHIMAKYRLSKAA